MPKGQFTEHETVEWEVDFLDARQGSLDALGRLLESCRNYLLLLANQQLREDLQAKAGGSDLVQDTFLEAQRDFRAFRVVRRRSFSAGSAASSSTTWAPFRGSTGTPRSGPSSAKCRWRKSRNGPRRRACLSPASNPSRRSRRGRRGKTEAVPGPSSGTVPLGGALTAAWAVYLRADRPGDAEI